MAVIALWIEYDGSAYVGWQRQLNGMSVQQRVEEALAQLTGQMLTIYSSGRTDAGVHARGMVAHFKTDSPLSLNAYLHGVNRFLPRDIAVIRVRQAVEHFHARYSAGAKWYQYRLYLAPVRSPLHAPYCWYVRKPLDIALIREAAQLFIGEHDFVAFRGSGCSARTTVRRIDSIDVQEVGDELHIDVRGSGFLRHMVRMMVGTLVQIGAGKRTKEDIHRLLSQGAGEETRLTAPAQGLCLMAVEYSEQLFRKEDSGLQKELDNTGLIS